MRLGHLNLTVADVDRSIAFYGEWFGFERELAIYEDGTVFVTDERDRHESHEYTGFKVRDPDGHSIEVYHERR